MEYRAGRPQHAACFRLRPTHRPSFSKEEARAACKDPALGVTPPEAACMDPQQALALQLTAKLWDDAGAATTAAVLAARERVGVYIGAWQPPEQAVKSAYAALGGTLSALAARVANAYDLQGPALTLNTACSSGLVAVDAALKDARAGRIDYAIVGGVNLISGPGGEKAFTDLKRANMLSPTTRCHTFSAAADGYVRAEGAVLFLLRSTAAPAAAGAPPARARVRGAAVNQNSQRRPMTAVDPVAQERVIRAACADAGVAPAALDAIEMHGTGTKLGDPVELSALAAVTREGEGAAPKPCVVTAAKMHFGHLESAAGALGMLKAALMCQHGTVPGFAVDEPGLNPNIAASLDGATGSRLALPPAAGAPLPPGALVGISSFGFAGNNAHVVMQALPPAADPTPPPAQPTAPATKSVAAPVAVVKPVVVVTAAKPAIAKPAAAGATKPTAVAPAVAAKPAPGVDREVRAMHEATKAVWAACCQIAGTEGAEMDENASFFDVGLDSLGLAELVIQLEELYGEGVITIDDVLASPVVSDVAAKLTGGTTHDALQKAPTKNFSPAPAVIASNAQRSPAKPKPAAAAMLAPFTPAANSPAAKIVDQLVQLAPASKPFAARKPVAPAVAPAVIADPGGATPPQSAAKLSAAFVADLSFVRGTAAAPTRRGGSPQLWRVRNTGDVPWPPGTRIRAGSHNLQVPLDLPGAVRPGDEVDVDVAELQPVALAPRCASFTAPQPATLATPVAALGAIPASLGRDAKPATSAKTPRAATAPRPMRKEAGIDGGEEGTPTARFVPPTLDVALGSAVAARLAKLEEEARGLRLAVLQYAAQPGGLGFGS